MDDFKLSIEDVTYKVKNLTILNQISAHATAKQGLTLKGESGLGKSTLIKLLAGLELPTAGRITYNEVEISKLNSAERAHFRRQFMGIAFQNPHLIPSLNVEQNIHLAVEVNNPDQWGSRLRVNEMMERFEIAHRRDAYVDTLSGGEARRVALARAFVTHPKIVLLDEPLTGLDQELAGRVSDTIEAIKEETGALIVVATHNMKIAKVGKTRLDFDLLPNKVDGQVTSAVEPAAKKAESPKKVEAPKTADAPAKKATKDAKKAEAKTDEPAAKDAKAKTAKKEKTPKEKRSFFGFGRKKSATKTGANKGDAPKTTEATQSGDRPIAPAADQAVNAKLNKKPEAQASASAAAGAKTKPASKASGKSQKAPNKTTSAKTTSAKPAGTKTAKAPAKSAPAKAKSSTNSGGKAADKTAAKSSSKTSVKQSAASSTTKAATKTTGTKTAAKTSAKTNAAKNASKKTTAKSSATKTTTKPAAKSSAKATSTKPEAKTAKAKTVKAKSTAKSTTKKDASK